MSLLQSHSFSVNDALLKLSLLMVLIECNYWNAFPSQSHMHACVHVHVCARVSLMHARDLYARVKYQITSLTAFRRIRLNMDGKGETENAFVLRVKIKICVFYVVIDWDNFFCKHWNYVSIFMPYSKYQDVKIYEKNEITTYSKHLARRQNYKKNFDNKSKFFLTNLLRHFAPNETEEPEGRFPLMTQHLDEKSIKPQVNLPTPPCNITPTVRHHMGHTQSHRQTHAHPRTCLHSCAYNTKAILHLSRWIRGSLLLLWHLFTHKMLLKIAVKDR